MEDADKDLTIKFPRVVMPFYKPQIARAASGGLPSTAMTTEGEVYTWGCNYDGALGRAGDENPPAKVPMKEAAVQAVGGDYHTAIVTLSGKVYTWGFYRDKDDQQWCDAATAKVACRRSRLCSKGGRMWGNVRCGSSFDLVCTNADRVFL